MTFRDWLHLIGIHYWSKWGWPLTGKVRGLGGIEEYDAIIQTSNCSICKKERARIYK